MTTSYPSLAARLAANSKRARKSNVLDIATGRTLTCACRLWTGNVNNSGYPRFTVRLGSQVVKQYAHRAAYEIATGQSLPSGMTIDHLCVRTRCIEPTHLEAVTQNENTHRKNVRLQAARLAA